MKYENLWRHRVVLFIIYDYVLINSVSKLSLFLVVLFFTVNSVAIL